MKKIAILLTLALLVMIPAMSLAEATPTETPAATQPAVPYGMQRGRWFQNPPADAPDASDFMPPWARWYQNESATQPNFVDENKDGVCDNCGNTPGQNPEAPGFLDENQDGVCDHFGTAQQFQNRMKNMRGQMMRRGRMGQGMMGNRFPGANQDDNGFQPPMRRHRQTMPGMQNRMPGRFR